MIRSIFVTNSRLTIIDLSENLLLLRPVSILESRRTGRGILSLAR